MEAYKRWVRNNKDYFHSLQSLANGMTWLLPERFSDSEIGPEAVTTILGIITTFNDHIIDTAPSQSITDSVEPCSFPYPLCLSALKDLETLVEVVARHYYGDDKKWDFLAATEGIKVLVRLSLFRTSGYKMLLYGGETLNDEKHLDSLTPGCQIGSIPQPGERYRSGLTNNYLGQNPWNLEGRALYALSKFGENAKMMSDSVCMRQLQQRPATMDPSEERPTLSSIFSKKGLRGVLSLVGEVLFIIRPLIYVLFIRKLGIWSWIPWFISLAFDILSLTTTSAADPREQNSYLSAPEKDEVKRRMLLFALYLMRDPFFSKYTRKKLESTEKVLEPVPVMGRLAAKIVELMIGAQTRYTYTSGS